MNFPRTGFTTSSNRISNRLLFLALFICGAMTPSWASAAAKGVKSAVQKLENKQIFFSNERGIALAKLETDTHWTCNMSLFFSMDENEQQALQPDADGRGIVSCKNRQGFQTDYPILAHMTLDKTPALQAILKRAGQSEFTVSMVSDQFSITRELTDVQDTYLPKPLSSNIRNDLLMMGEHSQVAFNISVTSRNRPIEEISVKSMKLSFDSEAPEIF